MRDENPRARVDDRADGEAVGGDGERSAPAETAESAGPVGTIDLTEPAEPVGPVRPVVSPIGRPRDRAIRADHADWVAEQLAAARAAEPAPAPPSLSEALSDLAAECADTLAAAWNGPYGRDLRLAARAGAHAALAAVATWLVALTLCVTVWLVSAPNTAGVGGPLRVAGQLWLLGHHAALDVPAGRLAMAPLGFTALLVFALWQTAAAPIARPVHIAYTAFGAATGYCLVAALVAAGAATDDVRPDTAQAVVFAVLFGALVPTAARWRRIVEFFLLPAWIGTAARAAAVATAVLAGGGAATLAAALITRMPEPGWPRGVADACGMLLLSFAVLPNALVWSTAYVLGPGFAVGSGSGVNLLSVKTGALPLFPLLGAVPRDASRLYPYDLAFLAIPLASGAAAALIVGRAHHPRLADRVRAVAAASVAVALTAGLAATLSDGPLAGGRMAGLGPSGWRTAAATLVLVGVTAAALVLLPRSALAVRGLSVGRLVRPGRRLLDAVAVLRPGRLAPEIGAGLRVPDEDDRQQPDQQDQGAEELVDDGDPAGAQAADAGQDADPEEDGGDDAGVVVAGPGGQGHPEPQAGADQPADDDAGDEDVLVAVDGALGVAVVPEVALDLVELAETDDDAD
ncbi:MAG: hypothetical protein AUG49_15095 [Catenulispora sp. 13_1_20CM_3_70_7]|nr:MAG: hypothetical protein AUG49_15095 [Catenulispora sp. 13_1_20CM_3_70_7]